MKTLISASNIMNALNDLIGLTGTGLLCFGLYTLAPWLAFATGGVLLMAFSFLNAKRINQNGEQ